MPKLMPQEIEVWYLIPALRKELARIFVVDYRLTQKEASKILGLTESAVSQYLKSKRAIDIKFADDELKEIRKTAKLMIKNKKDFMKHFYSLCTKLKGAESMCAFHKKQEKGLPKGCKICMGR